MLKQQIFLDIQSADGEATKYISSSTALKHIIEVLILKYFHFMLCYTFTRKKQKRKSEYFKTFILPSSIIYLNTATVYENVYSFTISYTREVILMTDKCFTTANDIMILPY